MGKASRTKRLSAREKIAAQQQAARRAERRNRLLITGGSVVVVLAVVLALVLVKVLGGSSAGRNVNARTALPASVYNDVTKVPASTLDAVGPGSVPSPNAPIGPISGAPLTSNGKPEMLYIGAEYCPYCAAMRWSMAIALSRFGTLSPPLYGIRSDPKDVYPSTATLTFYRAHYTSKYLTFTSVEETTVDHKPLESTTAGQYQLWGQYEPQHSRGYPFIDFGNKIAMTGPLFSPGALAGKNWSQIAAALHDPSSPITQGVAGAANYLTASICRMTNNQPASVCDSTAVLTTQGRL